MTGMRTIYRLILLMSMLVYLTGCSIMDSPEEGACHGDGVWLKLILSMDNGDTGATRTPAAGEDGDGREAGTANENAIKTLSLFFYKPSGDGGLNSPWSTKITATAQINVISSESTWNGTTFECLVNIKTGVPANGDRVAVIANHKFSASRLAQIKTLGKLRDITLDVPYTVSDNGIPADYTDFVMTSANSDDGIVVTNTAGTYADPYITQVTIQRMAARIDFWYNEKQNDASKITAGADRELVYPVKRSVDGKTQEVATAYLTHIVPFNVMQKGAWLFKRTTRQGEVEQSDLDIKNLIICGKELTKADVAVDEQIADNLVVEPHTITKRTASSSTLFDWYGDTFLTHVKEDLEAACNASRPIPELMARAVKKTDSTFPEFNRAFCLTYANENTESPAKYYFSLQGGKMDPSYATGLLFRVEYVPKTVYFYTNEQLIQGNYNRGENFWRYKKDGEELFFTSQESALGYCQDKGLDYAKYVKKYDNGVCYYQERLYHCNVGTVSTGLAIGDKPMQYATVRNNIYRVGVQFKGIGKTADSEPETDNIRLIVKTRKWNFRRMDEIKF